MSKQITAGDRLGTQFTFNFADDTPQEVVDGLKQAGENWSSVLKDNTKINVDFQYASAGDEDLLGGTRFSNILLPYTLVRQFLAEDVTSDTDRTAVANLPENSIDVLINNTSENNGSDIPYLDNNGSINNSIIGLNTANAKALGLSLEDLAESFGTTPDVIAAELSAESDDYLIDNDTVDASMELNSDIVWDFDPSDGISANAVDFVGTVTHELGHVLGFGSDADFLDQFADPDFVALDFLELFSLSDVFELLEVTDLEEIGELLNEADLNALADSVAGDRLVSENAYTPTTFDLFRYTPESFENSAIDFTVGDNGQYFSIDGGQTEIAPLSTGIATGDGSQLSHWRDNTISGDMFGIMDPTGMPGDLEQISDIDLLAVDAMGWDII